MPRQQRVEEHVLPVVAEELEVRKVEREIEHVRVTTHVDAHETMAEVPVQRDHVEITRVPVNRDVAGPIPPRQEGDTTIISLVEEVAVVTKKFVLKEEIRIARRRQEELARVPVTLHRESAVVERTAPPRSRAHEATHPSLERDKDETNG